MDKNIKQKLEQAGQDQVLRFWDQLTSAEQSQLASQLQALDLVQIQQLVDEYVLHRPQLHIPSDIKAAQVYPYRAQTPEHKTLYAQAHQQGLNLLKDGKVGAFLVAGGQGTRLGYEGPKGEYPVTPISKKPLFQVFAEQLLAHSHEAGKAIAWYIMTSDINDGPTRAFFQKHNFFGYDASAVFFFPQGMMPAFGLDGKMLLASRNSLALSPDGHGGSLRALHRSGALADMRRRGIEHLSYFQVDNPIVHTIDPLFLGLHDLSGSEMSSKTIAKAHALEKVGNFCVADGKLQVIEYSDLPEHLAKQTNPDGSLKFNAGSIAIHALRVSFVERLNEGGQLHLPWHRAEKKVNYINDAGQLVKPDKPNAIKLEQFVFDAIPLAANPIVYETDRSEEFSPVKNAEGVDSPHTSRRDQIHRHARWLRSCGCDIPAKGDEIDATIEISPLYAANETQFRRKHTQVRHIKPGEHVYIE
ncbi:MAG: UDPGP type 1 family protein [Phycisphaerales bacterium]|nr:UDPGP type 1 family protein [Phycisphaerales bacterium]